MLLDQGYPPDVREPFEFAEGHIPQAKNISAGRAVLIGWTRFPKTSVSCWCVAAATARLKRRDCC
ncbi:rhodanese-like domain-containing protein [Streptococcus pneumoniae]|uniref:rhodanese-like domain-containing protein n=1 Tax=Streptococcus pneumoniae TaxID=1313 RepID=UPI0034DB4EB0